MNPENLKILTKWENMIKQGGKQGEKGSKTLNFVLMLVMRFLTNKQVFKAPSWYLTQTFWGKSFKKHGKMWKKGEKIFFSSSFFYFT